MVKLLLENDFMPIHVMSESNRIPADFPCVTFLEANNVTRRDTLDSAMMEHHANVMYEVNVYSNKTIGRQSECRKILDTIDRLLLQKGFVRTYMNPVPNMNDSTIYRIVARYVATISKERVVYGR